MPVFLTRRQIERLHDEALHRWGGSEGIGDYQAMIAVAEKRMSKADLAALLRRLGTAPP